MLRKEILSWAFLVRLPMNESKKGEVYSGDQGAKWAFLGSVNPVQELEDSSHRLRLSYHLLVDLGKCSKPQKEGGHTRKGHNHILSLPFQFLFNLPSENRDLVMLLD